MTDEVCTTIYTHNVCSEIQVDLTPDPENEAYQLAYVCEGTADSYTVTLTNIDGDVIAMTETDTHT